MRLARIVALAGLLFLAVVPASPGWLARRSPELDGLRASSLLRRSAPFLPILAAGLFQVLPDRIVPAQYPDGSLIQQHGR